MLAAERQRFVEDYLRIRRAEGRGSDDPAYYLALPYRDLSGRLAEQWKMRGRTYRYFERRILPSMERGRPLDLLDLGAGCGWMSYRLALRGHRPVAVDILTDGRDGLGAARHYLEHAAFSRFNAEFDQLPFRDASFDAAMFNASLHYSSDYFKNVARGPALPAAGRAHRDSGFARLPQARAWRNDAPGAAPAISGAIRHRIRPRAQHRIPGYSDARYIGARIRNRVADSQAVVWIRVASAAGESVVETLAAAFALLDSGGNPPMILFFNPRATRPKNRRYPLSILAIAAMIEGKEEYAIVDGNLDDNPQSSIERSHARAACPLARGDGDARSSDEGVPTRVPVVQTGISRACRSCGAAIFLRFIRIPR